MKTLFLYLALSLLSIAAFSQQKAQTGTTKATPQIQHPATNKNAMHTRPAARNMKPAPTTDKTK